MKERKRVVLLSGGLESATILALTPGISCIGFCASPDSRAMVRARAIADHFRSPFEAVVPPKIDDRQARCDSALHDVRSRGFDAATFGWCATDWRQNPDAPPYFELWAKRAGIQGVRIHAPLFYLTKRQVVAVARRLGVPIDLTWSCWAPEDQAEPCGHCIGCVGRQDAMNG